MEKRIGLLFDCLRAPYDAANIIQVAAALGNCDIYLSGNSIDINNKKIISKVKSWDIIEIPKIEIFTTFYEAVDILHQRDKYLIGTSPYAKKSFYDLNLTKGNNVLVFGTETSGLSFEKMKKLEDMVFLPTAKNVPFLTLSVIVPILSYEIYRQMEEKK